jgi:RND superfamily putative drug exporter
LLGVKTGLSLTERFIDTPEAVAGQEVLAEGFSAGSGSPAVVVAPAADAVEVSEAIAQFPGVDEALVAEETEELARINVVLAAEAESEAALETVREMRERLDQVASGEALVGGVDAESVDVKAATQADQNLAIPLILALVFVVLVILLRALLAPILLLLTVVASFFSSVGASWLLFEYVLGFPALDDNVILLSFLFLVALGVDYNIFLVTRAKEEAETLGLRRGMVRGLAATGGVITSAGILLAAVFAVLGVLPLITLTQIGIIVCVGVLLDTLLVRTVIVPSLAFLVGDSFWWPRRPKVLSRRH